MTGYLSHGIDLSLSGLATRQGGGAAFPATMPSGAIGVWVMGDYDNAVRPMVPNAVATQPASRNLLSLSRKFSDVSGAIASNTVLTEGLTGPDGVALATRLVGTASTNWYARLDFPLNAGTYSFCFSVKSNTGSDQPFSLLSFMDGAAQDYVATPTWQRFRYTWTATGACTFLGPKATAAQLASDLLFDNFELFAGSADLGPEVCAGHMLLGDISAFSTSPVVNGAVLEYGSGKNSHFSFPIVSSAAWTAICVAKKLSTTAQALNAYMSGEKASADNFLGMFGRLRGLASFKKTAVLASVNNVGYRMFASVYDATSSDVWIDDVIVATESGGASKSITNISNCFYVNSGFYHDYGIAAMALYNRRLSPEELGAAFNALSTRLELGSVSLVKCPNLYVPEGDSITFGQGMTPYPVLAGWDLANAAIVCDKFATAGATIAALNGRASTLDAFLNSFPAKRRVLSVLVGCNDLHLGASPATFISDLTSYLTARRAAVSGLKIVGCTILPSTLSDVNTGRAIVNPSIAGLVGTTIDALADFAADATMGPDAAALNATYYPDGTHPSDAGHALLQPIIAAAVNPLLV